MADTGFDTSLFFDASYKALLLAHPCSGELWLRDILSEVYGEKHDAPINDLARLFSDKEFVEPQRRGPRIILARDPRDLIPAQWFSVIGRKGRGKGLYKHPAIMGFSDDKKIGLCYLIEAMNRWLEIPNALLIKYETLVTDPVLVVRSVLSFLHLEECALLAKMSRKLEIKVHDYCPELGGTISGRHDIYRVGLHEHCMTHRQIAGMNKRICGSLHEDYGYGR